jgi:hypothetical protein
MHDSKQTSTPTGSSSNTSTVAGGWQAVQTEQQLVCGACPQGWVSPGGLIGATFCNTCPPGQVPDDKRQACVGELRRP